VESPTKQPKKVLKGFFEKEVQAMINAYTYQNYIESKDKAIIARLAD
jgi:integrase/recombinase XerD